MALAEIANYSPPVDDMALEEELLRSRQENDPETQPEGEAAKEAEDPIARLMRWGDPMVNVNIATELSDEELSSIGMKVIEEAQIDENSRKEWLETGRKAMDLCLQKVQAKTSPWPGACYSLDTDILTDRGWKPIGEAKVGDMVLSRAPDGTADYYPVTEAFRHTATHMVHFEGKSIDLLVTPNHKMLVETDYPVNKRTINPGVRGGKYRRRQTGTVFIDDSQFIYAGDFLKYKLGSHYIPMTSSWAGGVSPQTIYGIPAKAYVRLLGWYIAEGWANYPAKNLHTLKNGETKDYGPTTSSFGIAQSKKANPAKYKLLKQDIEACGLTFQERDEGFTVHARSMPEMMKAELRALGRSADKHIPRHVMSFGSELLTELLDTMIAGDGHARHRAGKQESRSYYTISALLADQVQEICQKLGMRATISVREARMGGIVNGRQIAAASISYSVAINTKPRIKVATMDRRLVPYGKDVACVEVAPHHTIYVRRNGKALWCGNSNVIFPLMTQAADQFAARAYPAIIQNRNVVKGVVSGDDNGIPQIDPQTRMPVIDPQTQEPMWEQKPGAKAERAARIGDHMSWQLIEEQTEWEGETDVLLHVLPVVGCEFRKCYYDPDMGRNVATRVSAENLIINYWAKSMETAPRLTEVISLYPYEIKERTASGFYKEHEYTAQPVGKKADLTDKDSPHEFYEQHRRLDLDNDGYPEPYIVTVHKDSMKVARIVAGYDIDGGIKTNAQTGKIAVIRPVHYYTKYDFMPNKEGGIYGWGFGHLLSHINISINSVLNMLIDAGTLQNTGGGFVGKGLSMHSGNLSFRPGELKPVSAIGSTIRDSIYMLDHKGPSPVLYTLLGTLMEAGKDISSVKDILSGDLKAQTMSPTVFMALVEQGLKVFTAIYKRIHRSLKDEFEKLFRLNRLYLEEQTSYRRGAAWKMIKREDYEADTGVDPVSDPTMVVDAQRMARTQVLAEFKDDPLCDGIEIRRRIFEAASIADVDKILKTQQDSNPELILKAAELELKSIDIKAGVLLKISQALLNMAKADQAVVEPMQTWTQLQMQQLQNQYEAINSKTEGTTNEQDPTQSIPSPGMPAAIQATPQETQPIGM